MRVLSGSADEIDPDPEARCPVLDGPIRDLGLRSAWDTGVLDRADEQLGGPVGVPTAHGILDAERMASR